jgi:hypothetical protein
MGAASTLENALDAILAAPSDQGMGKHPTQASAAEYAAACLGQIFARILKNRPRTDDLTAEGATIARHPAFMLQWPEKKRGRKDGYKTGKFAFILPPIASFENQTRELFDRLNPAKDSKAELAQAITRCPQDDRMHNHLADLAKAIQQECENDPSLSPTSALLHLRLDSEKYTDVHLRPVLKTAWQEDPTKAAKYFRAKARDTFNSLWKHRIRGAVIELLERHPYSPISNEFPTPAP